MKSWPYLSYVIKNELFLAADLQIQSKKHEHCAAFRTRIANKGSSFSGPHCGGFSARGRRHRRPRADTPAPAPRPHLTCTRGRPAPRARQATDEQHRGPCGEKTQPVKERRPAPPGSAPPGAGSPARRAGGSSGTASRAGGTAPPLAFLPPAPPAPAAPRPAVPLPRGAPRYRAEAGSKKQEARSRKQEAGRRKEADAPPRAAAAHSGAAGGPARRRESPPRPAGGGSDACAHSRVCGSCARGRRCAGRGGDGRLGAGLSPSLGCVDRLRRFSAA